MAVFLRGRLPKGRKLAVLGFSGGTTSLCADLCDEMKLDLPSLPEQTAAKLNAELRGFLSAKNPLDLGGPNPSWVNSVYRCISLLGETELFDMAVLISARGEETYVPVLEAGAKAAHEKGLAFAHVLAVSAPVADSLKHKAREMNVPLLQDIRRGFQSIRRLVEYGELYDRSRLRHVAADRGNVPAKAREMLRGGKVLGERDAKELLSLYGIPVTQAGLALDLKEGLRLADEIGYPVAVKIDSPDIAHKTEVGGVQLGIRDAYELEAAYRQIMGDVASKAPGAAIQGVSIQKMVKDGLELIVGMHRDPQFGPVILCGFGGVLAELLSDFSLRLCPLDPVDVEAMLAQLKGASLLRGYRGGVSRDLKAVGDVLLKLSELSDDFSEEIESIDINPLAVFADGQGVQAVDALIVLRRASREAR